MAHSASLEPHKCWQLNLSSSLSQIWSPWVGGPLPSRLRNIHMEPQGESCLPICQLPDLTQEHSHHYGRWFRAVLGTRPQEQVNFELRPHRRWSLETGWKRGKTGHWLFRNFLSTKTEDGHTFKHIGGRMVSSPWRQNKNTLVPLPWLAEAEETLLNQESRLHIHTNYWEALSSHLFPL